MANEIDILENELRDRYPDVLDILLLDRTASTEKQLKNIFFATDNYKKIGPDYSFVSPIRKELITGRHGSVITPRIKKSLAVQKSRSKDMAEVFTPAWVCNAQNNLVDNAWFGSEGVFNTEITGKDGKPAWTTTENRITFPKGKTWQDYVKDNRMEISCGEAPYITSRYDTTNGSVIPAENRIGILDRKLRVVNENCDTREAWLETAGTALKSTYAYEWQGDSLLIARESILYAVLDNYRLKFDDVPGLEFIKRFAEIISWNVWQMDGLKCVIPCSCKSKEVTEEPDLFADPAGRAKTKTEPCEGCAREDIKKHNGTYCKIMDWEAGKLIKFVDMVK